jgi:hypothetical protein
MASGRLVCEGVGPSICEDWGRKPQEGRRKYEEK